MVFLFFFFLDCVCQVKMSAVAFDTGSFHIVASVHKIFTIVLTQKSNTAAEVMRSIRASNISESIKEKKKNQGTEDRNSTQYRLSYAVFMKNPAITWERFKLDIQEQKKNKILSLVCFVLNVLRGTGHIWPSIAETVREQASPEGDHMHASHPPARALQYLRKHTAELHFSCCPSVGLKPCFVWLISWIKASGKLVILLLYSSGNRVHMEARSLCWPVLDTGLLCAGTVLLF